MSRNREKPNKTDRPVRIRSVRTPAMPARDRSDFWEVLKEHEKHLANLTSRVEALFSEQKELKAAVEGIREFLPALEQELHADVDRVHERLATTGAPLDKDPGLMIRRIGALVRRLTPRNANVIVVGKPDTDLQTIAGRRCWPFLQNLKNEYAGYYPATDVSAIAQLEVLRARGADYFVIPETSRWWVDHYRGFHRHVGHRYKLVADEPDAGLIFSLRESSRFKRVWSELEDVIEKFQNQHGRPPSIVDWHTGLELVKEFPDEPVFSPASASAPLPYLDESVDVVVVSGGDATRLTEAQRVAQAATVTVAEVTPEPESTPFVQAQWKFEIAGAEPPVTSIIIPCFNSYLHTQACLTALIENLPQNFRGEIIVVDDASTDETPAKLREWAKTEKRLRVIRNRRNAGFIASVNKGADEAKGEILVFLNNDTIPLPGWLSSLWKIFRNYPDAGAAGGKLVFPDGTLQEAGGIVFRDGSAAHFGRGDYNPDEPLYSYVRQVDYCSGAMLATPRALFWKIGGFDSYYKPAYYEDTDYCFKLREQDHRVYFQPQSVAVHVEGATAGTDLSAGSKQYQAINQIKFARRWERVLKDQNPRPGHFDFTSFHRLAIRHGQSTNTKRALVCALMPEPDRDSGSRRVLHIVESLQALGWTLTFVSHHEKPGPRYVRELQQRGIAVYSGDSKWMEKLAATGDFDLAIFGLWDIAEPYISILRKLSPRTRIIVESIDLHFLRNARRVFRAGWEKKSPGTLDLKYASEMIREINTYAAADAVLTVSEKEMDAVNDITGEPALAFTVPDGEDPSPPLPLDVRKGIVFVGCFRHMPNATAAEYLCKEIVPRIPANLLKRHPVYVVGDGLNDTIRGYGANLQGVQMVGWVPSITPYLKNARISVVPLLYGAGTKRKLLQSVIYGTPAVSTRIGVEGLPVRNGEHVLIADDPSSFADCVIRLLEDDELWTQIEEQGRVQMTAFHAREAIHTALATAIDGVLARPAKPCAAGDASSSGLQRSFTPEEYRQIVESTREAARKCLEPDARVVVVSRGDEQLLDLGVAYSCHFPRLPDGRYKGHHPANSQEAITELESLRMEGADHFLLPSTALWWFEHYADFKRHLDENYKQVLSDEGTCVIYALHTGQSGVAVGESRDASNAPETASEQTRLIAFYLPQFHPIPENDLWWGPGFTEWANVAKAHALFQGHYQPRLPADCGFYDLRLPEVRRAQARLAKSYGIHGFCYYHFWFQGKLLLDRPFNEVLQSGEPDFPFCLCWANEPWTRRWDGRPKDVLQPQTYSYEDDCAHIRWLLPALADRRAIRIDGKPVFIVYQAQELPTPQRTTDAWREEVQKAGLGEIYLIACETGWDAGWDATKVGFDAKVAFQPQFATLFNSGTELKVAAHNGLRVFDYAKAWRAMAELNPVAYRRYDTVCPNWDNSARRGDQAVVLHNSAPEAYEMWLRQTIVKASSQPEEHRIVFINAWNEWGEGCYLEPDKRYGRAYLEATRRALLPQALHATVSK